ncbi:glycosyltransferase [Salegentibacter sp. Hel_I_6]|uniref:glycosyltransferase n=1 Tax=Salegentibacter sp. Hel_I_6 TaxID=1250278 RepID=UPI00055B3A92|nr:glycosyltransferase [Salegentibacter sp. Hel_I_6]
MKIIHINLAKTWRGGERQVALLFKGLQNQGIDQLLICSKNSALANYAQEQDWNFLAIPRSPFFLLAQARTITRLSKKGYNIIHCHESKAHTLGILAKTIWNSNQKLIVHRRVIFPIKKKITTAVKYSEKHLEKIICISRAVEESVKKSIAFNKIVVVPSLIEINSKTLTTSVLREPFRIKSEFIVGYIAALTKEKDHYTFLDTAKEILETKELNVHFVIIGEGELKNELKAYSEKLGITKNLSFTGFIKDIQAAINEVDLLLFTSTSEGLGTTILDFFVAKKPVVATRSGGAEELIINGETGYLCDCGNSKDLKEKVLLILKNPEKKQEIVNKAYKFVQNFNIEKGSLKTLEVYKSVE